MSATALSRLDDLASLTGKELLAAIHDGEVPPPAAAELLDLTLLEIHDGRAVFKFRPTPRFDNGQGAVHGGLLSAVADFAVSTAVKTLLGADAAVVTTTSTSLTSGPSSRTRALCDAKAGSFTSAGGSPTPTRT